MSLFDETVEFTVYIKPQPQGSAKAFVMAGQARITSDNKQLKPYRSEVTGCAIQAVAGRNLAKDEAVFGKHVPVTLTLEFVFRKPESSPKRRTHPVVKPDLDKLCRSTKDALTGVIWHDDSQVVALTANKVYGAVECVHVRVELLT